MVIFPFAHDCENHHGILRFFFSKEKKIFCAYGFSGFFLDCQIVGILVSDVTIGVGERRKHNKG